MEKKTERRDWGEIKNAYITGKESLNKLAERYEIPLRTIKDRSRKENWRNWQSDIENVWISPRRRENV